MSGADVAPGGLVFYNVSHFYWYFIIFDGDRAIRPLTIIEPGHIQTHRRPPIVESKPRNVREAVTRVARLRSVEGSGIVGLGETLGSPWIPLPYGSAR